MTVIENINRNLEKYDMIIMVIDGKGIAQNLTKKFCQSEALRKASRKVLVLSNIDIGHMGRDDDHWECIRLSEEEWGEVLQLYMMYDFSDRFLVLSDNSQYGSLMNYVKTGIMTMEDIFQAFLG